MKVWMKVEVDKYELPVMVCDTAQEMAERNHVKLNTVYSAACHAARGKRKCYIAIEIDEEGDL